ncbi:MAG: uL15 family ribosomal protein [Clostridia bacterium]|nr:uL15 family ribosomal protein [Clostridia bacterium]
MQIHELKTNFKKAKRTRGGKKGTYCGRGMKGQHSRAGTRFQPMIRNWLDKYHKMRGWQFNIRDKKSVTFSFSKLEKNFEQGNTISPETLYEKGLITKSDFKKPKVKILAKGELTKAFVFENCEVSKKAREIIEKQKGEIK